MKLTVEDAVTSTGNLFAMMVGGRSSVSMDLFQKQEIACLGCQMTTFNLSPLSMNLSVLVSISRLLLCPSKAVLARKSFFPLIAQNAEENLEGYAIILHEWQRKRRMPRSVHTAKDSYTHGRQKQAQAAKKSPAK